ncbi:MAG TPA: tRNA uridine(34) 5-carboxymethylaminomethyl modification radical SAM/GNAT enzyme Elp3 [Candidatus Pacearchaeota archaeon]|nr:tRNA uridine(34) 5-carboxymethylaminomethyl modification radical SAM/GNAT enzyme Elp3 [Candidatus Pacearchaeota archaeon]HPR79818.1 tRNA uridine(34) 5-carboxymethylaminomethyl modification radical SAM/GNAT enzyme Elp3 [Candidatus Pacearchaeota archaeon]
MKTNELIIKELLKLGTKTQKDLSSAKRKISKEYKVSCPSNISLLQSYHNLIFKKRIKKSEKIEKLLKTRPVRSLSGIVNVSVLTKPYECPGKCLYCPSETDIPKSYLSGEPAVERAKKLNFDPYLQTQKRIEVLDMSGHTTDKIELRMIGGTWSFYDLKYKIWFVKKCFEAANNQKNKKENFRTKKIDELWKELELAQKKNEKAKCRIIGMSFETRPDYINSKEIIEMRRLGSTKIELGVQSIYDDILKFNKRGHGIKETIKATELLKNAGFKVAYQMMLNLPKSNPQKDIKMFKELFNNQNFKPDSLKIYPCALVKEAPLYNLYLKKQYKPYKERELIETIKSIKKLIPRYVRIERIVRDIPSPLIVEGGAKISNLRQIIDIEAEKENWHCQCIRCREIKDSKSNDKICLMREDYDASNGKEIFLSFEDKERKNIYSLLRLRINSNNENVIPVLKDSAITREVHVYGQAASISKQNSLVQHKGLGQQMIKEAERIAKEEFRINKIAIISGIGARNYYKEKLGYKLKDGYMIKSLID